MLSKTALVLLFIQTVAHAALEQEPLKVSYQTSSAVPIPDSPFRALSLSQSIEYTFLECDRSYDQSKERTLITSILKGNVHKVSKYLNRGANPFDLIFMRINEISERHCAYTIAFQIYKGKNAQQIREVLAGWIDKNIAIVKNSVFNTMYDADLIIFESLINELATIYYHYYTYTDYFGIIQNRLKKAKFDQMSATQLLEAAEEIHVLSEQSPVLFSPITQKVAELTSRKLKPVQSCSELPALDSPNQLRRT